jgi:hypothetical protein
MISVIVEFLHDSGIPMSESVLSHFKFQFDLVRDGDIAISLQSTQGMLGCETSSCYMHKHVLTGKCPWPPKIGPMWKSSVPAIVTPSERNAWNFDPTRWLLKYFLQKVFYIIFSPSLICARIEKLILRGSLGFKSVSWRSPVRVPQISGPLEIYMVINFRAHKINRGTRKLLQILTFKKKKKELSGYLWGWSLC